MIKGNLISTMVALIADSDGVKRVTKYLSPTQTVKVTRQGRCDGRCDGRSRCLTVVVSIGSPNFVERNFIAACKKAGEPFPVKKLQIKRVPERD